MANKSKKPIKNMRLKVSTAKVMSALHSFLTTANANANVNVSNSIGTNANASADVSLGLGKSTSQVVQLAGAISGSQDLDQEQVQDYTSEVDWDTDTENQDLADQDLECSQVMTDKLTWAEHVAWDQVNLGAVCATPPASDDFVIHSSSQASLGNHCPSSHS